MHMDTQRIIEQLHPLERKILPVIKEHSALETHVALSCIVEKSQLLDIEVIRAAQWLQNKGIVTLTEEITDIGIVSKKGQEYVHKKLPERRFLEALHKGPLSLQEIKQHAQPPLHDEEANISIGLLRKKNCLEIHKDAQGQKFGLTSEGKKWLTHTSSEEQLFEKLKKESLTLKSLTSEHKNSFEELMRRNLVQKEALKHRSVKLTELGKKVIQEKIDVDVVDRITPEMLRMGSPEEFRKKTFRRYDTTSSVPKTFGGKRHFVHQTIEYVKQIWLELGFKEMSGSYVHTSFWDMDSLFVPQDHPAREMQDTFYLKNPNKGKLPPLWKKIKAVHETGGTTKSKGWQTPWSKETAKELLLRTHTTVLSAQTLSKLNKKDLPQKFFNVGKVWRNEALDWKHLFEFYQVDGIVVDENANFRHLLAYLKEFFGKMGYKDARIRPAHFPYTYLSGEVDVLLPEKNQWIELGGCGIFRPEVTVPLLGFECPVLAWGLGLERIICPYYGITDLRDLYKNDVKMLRDAKAWLR